MCDNFNSHVGTRGEKGAKSDDGGCGRHTEEGQGGRQHSQRLFRQRVQQVKKINFELCSGRRKIPQVTYM
jgi:hypothetical protein